MIQKMENQLLPQKSLPVLWQSPSRTSWGTGIILVLLCGLGLLLLLLIPRTPSSPPCKTRRVTRKGQVQMRRRTRSKTKSKTLKVYRNCLENLKEAQSIISLLKSYVGKLHDDSISHLSHWHLPGDECNPAPAGNKQPHQETEEDVSPDTLSTLASLAPPSQPPPPLAPFLPEEPQEVQSDMKRIPTGPVSENSPPRNSYLASLGTAIPGFDRLSSSISLFFWWWPTAKALLLLTSPHGRCQQEHLSYHPPEASLWGDATHRQVEAGGPSFISPAVQELLEMSISKRVELMLKAEEKTGSLLNQRRPSYILKSLGTLLRSLSNKQAATMPQPFWNLENKPKQLPDPQHLSYSEVFGDDLEQKYSQLFWGLPSLHSESLVAAAWVSNKKPVSRTPTVRFNTNVTTQTQSADAPQVSQAQPLPPYQSTQSQSLTTNSPFNLGQIHTQPQPPCSFPNQQSSSLVKGRTCRMTCPTSQDKARSIIPTYNEEMDWPLQMPLHRLWAARSSLQKNQDVAGQPSPNLPQDSWASRICQCNAKNILESSKSSQPFDTADERDKDFQMRFVLPGRHFRKNAKRSHLGKPRKDLEQDRHEQDHLSSHVSIPEDIMGSESDLTRPRRRDYEDYKPKSPDQKQMKQILKAHLVKKLWQIKENRIPVRVSQSWITVSHAFPKSDTHSKSRKLLSLKHQHPGVNTSQELYFLDSLTRRMLEAHIKKCREKHGWDLDYSQGLRINSAAAQTLHHPQCTFPSLLANKSVANVTTNIARSLGDPQKVRLLQVPTPGEGPRLRPEIPDLQSMLLSYHQTYHQAVNRAVTLSRWLTTPQQPNCVASSFNGSSLPLLQATLSCSTEAAVGRSRLAVSGHCRSLPRQVRAQHHAASLPS
ncbi:spermatogenesis-associated protein 31E1-like [Ochotona princeps]|uniref:spermatogenesis-associated protein 31E1-like n=1 Tax=Ochotona princeps TaxID=9978 RepID=UPI002714F0A6|nr:spermatogenesis-associated protein 31E1-like [Ochotona princeps]